MTPPPPRAQWPAWLAAFGLVLSPFVIFFDASPAFGELAWLESAAGLLIAFAVTVGVCVRQRRLLPLGLSLLLVVTLPVGWLTNLHFNFPCVAYANASWCGHFCDDDPCMCPQRSLGPAAYGPGSSGCVGE